jgi:hypothetical protein
MSQNCSAVKLSFLPVIRALQGVRALRTRAGISIIEFTAVAQNRIPSRNTPQAGPPGAYFCLQIAIGQLIFLHKTGFLGALL